jgi:hypothetical protein
MGASPFPTEKDRLSGSVRLKLPPQAMGRQGGMYGLGLSRGAKGEDSYKGKVLLNSLVLERMVLSLETLIINMYQFEYAQDSSHSMTFTSIQ